MENINEKFKKIIIPTIAIILFFTVLSTTMAAENNITNTTEGGLNTAISDSNSGDTINLDTGIYKGSNNTNITIPNSKNITIQSKNPNQKATIDGENINWFINNGGNLTLINVVLQNFIKSSSSGTLNITSGGAIYNTGRLTIINCTFLNNNVALYGGAIYNAGPNQTIINSTFKNNSAQSGGAIFNNNPTTILNSTFTNNVADTNNGGAIFNTQFTRLNISNSNFTNNSANQGGAIYNNNFANVIVNSSNFINNTATQGGAIYTTNGGNVNLSYSRLLNNTDLNNYTIYNSQSSVVLDYNWWGSNLEPNSQIFNGATTHYFIMNVTNLTSLDSNGTVTFDYTFRLNSGENADNSLLPYFVIDVYTNLTDNVVTSFDARYDNIFDVTIDTGGDILYTFIDDNEIQTLEGTVPIPEPVDPVDPIDPIDPEDPVEPIVPEIPTDPIDPEIPTDPIASEDPENILGPENDSDTTNNQTTASAAMKETGIPINLLLLVLLSLVGFGYYRKQ
jgi:predicted outer membrane repeat protein